MPRLKERGLKTKGELSDNLCMGRKALPLVLERSRMALQQFLQDDHKTGHFPLPRYRMEEMLLVLSLLRDLEVHPDFELPSKSDLLKNTRHPKRHLLLLFPLLCDCITIAEPSIKTTLREIFHNLSRLFGLG